MRFLPLKATGFWVPKASRSCLMIIGPFKSDQRKELGKFYIFYVFFFFFFGGGGVAIRFWIFAISPFLTKIPTAHRSTGIRFYFPQTLAPN